MWVSVLFCKHFMSSSGLKKEVKDEIVIKVGVHDSLTSIKVIPHNCIAHPFCA